MKVTAVVAIAAIVFQLHTSEAGKPDCKETKKNLKNCLKIGWKPSGGALDTEECTIGEGSIKKKKQKKCAEAEQAHVGGGCPALCKGEEEEEEEEVEEEVVEEGQCVKTPQTVAQCKLSGQRLGGAQLVPGYYDGYTYENCVTLCQTLAGCEAVVYKAAPKRCFVKSALYQAATPDAASASAEMCCLRGDCHCEEKGGSKEGLGEKKSVLDCTLTGINFPGGQLSTGYYDGFDSLDACVNKCRSLPGCVNVARKIQAKRCFVKGDSHRGATADTTGYPVESLRMCCLDGTC